MDFYASEFSRRQFLRTIALGAAGASAWRVFADEALRFVEDGDFAQQLVLTPNQTEGPFYPDRMPLDVDNDLLLINGRTTPAIGEIAHLSGKVLDARGKPLKDAVVEIWQVDSHGAYIHSMSDNRDELDKNFQGFGRFQTASNGEYKFRTIKPVAYPGRTPHIHVKVLHKDRELLTTQCYVKGDPRNDRDGIIRSIRDPKARESVIVPFDPIADSKIGELAARFDIVLGYTPADVH